jgi:hypothetical protein
MLRPDVIHRAVESVDREVALLAAHASVAEAAQLDDFRRSWARLVDLLELGSPADASTGEAGEIVPPMTRSVT